MSKSKHKKKMPTALRRYWAGKRKSKHKKRSYHMAKKKSKSRSRRRHVAHRRGRRRSHGGSQAFSIVPKGDEIKLLAAAGAVGWLESKSKSEPDFILNKVPRPVAALGWMGNTALMLRVAGAYTKHPYVKVAAKVASMVAIYQLGRKGGVFAKGDEFLTVAGDDGMGHEMLLDDDHLAALDVEANHISGDDDDVGGVAFDDAVNDAVEHT